MVKILLLLAFILTIVLGSIPFDEDIARKMINISAATYYVPKEDIKANRCPRCHSGFQVQKMVKTPTLFAMVGYDTTIDAVVVAFMGSNSTSNFILDAVIIPSIYGAKSCLFCPVHLGFRNGIVSLNSLGLKKAISESIKQHPSSKIIFTGHSLGGALANLAAVQYAEKHPDHKDVRLYTLGQPRVGGAGYAKYHESKVPHYFRLVHAKDLVPHKPALLKGGALFIHTGTQVWYQYGMTNKKICYNQESIECSNSLGSKTSDYTWDHHGSGNYLKLEVPEQKLEEIVTPEL